MMTILVNSMKAAIALAMTAPLWVAPEAEAATMSRLCKVDQVGVMNNRIHIKCAPLADKAYTKDIPYYAMNLTEDARKVDNIIALAIAAKQINKPLVVWFDWDDYRSVPGCQGNDCRKLVSAALE